MDAAASCPNVVPGTKCVDPSCTYCRIAADEGRKPLSHDEAARIIAEPITAHTRPGIFARLRAWLAGIDDPLITPKDD